MTKKDSVITIDINSVGFTTGSNKELVHYVKCNANQYINLVKIVMNNHLTFAFA